MNRLLEIGSSFELPPPRFADGKGKPFFDGGGTLWTPSGRDAFLLIASEFSERKTLHIPAYFCPHTRAFLERIFDIKTYEDSPLEARPNLESLRAKKDDAVLAVNIFGMRKKADWVAFYASNPDLVFIEDHSHAPFSKWASESPARYSMASLRKSFPLCAGYCRGLEKTRALSGFEDSAAFAAAEMKTRYLSGGNLDKADFLETFARIERGFEEKTEASAMGPRTREILAPLDVGKMQGAREKNFMRVARILDDGAYPLNFINRDIFDANSLFNPVLLAENARTRNALRAHLISRGIYAPVHWELGASAPEAAFETSRRLMTIPLDYRYSEAHCEHFRKALEDFFA